MANLFLLASTTATILLFLSPFITASSPVLDRDGNPLQSGVRYYVGGAFWGALARGGVSFERKGPNLCPSYVAQSMSELNKGIPIVFTPVDSTQTEITVDTKLSITFAAASHCRSSNVWMISRGGFISNDGTHGGLLSTFKIQEISGPGHYQFSFCFDSPIVFPVWPPRPPLEICKQVDAFVPGENGRNWLSVVQTEHSLPGLGFTFEKVEDVSTKSLVAQNQMKKGKSSLVNE